LQYNAAIVKNIGRAVKLVLNYDTWFSDPDRNLSAVAAVLDALPFANATLDLALEVLISRHERGRNQIPDRK